MQNFFFLLIAISNACGKLNTPIARGKRVSHVINSELMEAIGSSNIKRRHKSLALAVFNFCCFLADETGPAEEPKRTKRVQGWSRQILILGFGIVFATIATVL